MVVFIVKPSKIKILQVCAIFYLPFIRVSELYSKKYVSQILKRFSFFSGDVK